MLFSVLNLYTVLLKEPGLAISCLVEWPLSQLYNYIKVSVSYDHIINAYNFNHHRIVYKANALLLLLPSIVTRKLFANDITTEKALGIWNLLMKK